MNRVARALVALASLWSCACLTTPPPRPDVDVVVVPDARGDRCGSAPELVLGAPPEGALELARVHLRSRPRPLARYQRVLLRVARERCVGGVSLLRAEEEQGGVVRADAVLWSPAAAAPSP
ncbi:MAG: hypothetical protein IT383_10170 [Deltaproteobacteria bacterium]|nr:hypothetical protein [Deltaproteobacteria bacterium]